MPDCMLLPTRIGGLLLALIFSILDVSGGRGQASPSPTALARLQLIDREQEDLLRDPFSSERAPGRFQRVKSWALDLDPESSRLPPVTQWLVRFLVVCGEPCQRTFHDDSDQAPALAMLYLTVLIASRAIATETGPIHVRARPELMKPICLRITGPTQMGNFHSRAIVILCCAQLKWARGLALDSALSLTTSGNGGHLPPYSAELASKMDQDLKSLRRRLEDLVPGISSATAPTVNPPTPAELTPASYASLRQLSRVGGTVVGIAFLTLLMGRVVQVARRRNARRALSEAIHLLDSGKAAQALPAFQRLLATPPEPPDEIKCQIARCLLATNEVSLAVKTYRDLDPAKVSRHSLYKLAQTLEGRAQTDLAFELYTRMYLADASFQDVKACYERLKAQQAAADGGLGLSELAARLPARYTNVERLGMGGMGVVLKAHDTQLACPVAIKLISPLVAQDVDLTRRFAREVKALTLLQHPNVVRLLDAQTGAQPFYSMEYCPIPNLRHLLRDGPLRIGRALDIAVQVARALDCAHQQGIAHRDIKPENILVGADDLVKVVDFGLAQIAGATRLTRTGQIPGTLVYMPPEQLANQISGPPGDVYALGLVLQEMLIGKAAYDQDTWMSKAWVPPPRLPAHEILGEQLADLVARMEDRQPAARPAAGEVVSRLSALRARLPTLDEEPR